MKKRRPLGQVQLEVLRHISDRAPVTVADVAEHFARTEGKARTTVLTIMEQLRAKGFLARRKTKGAFRYSPTISQGEVLQGVVRRFVSETLKGSVSPFIAYLADSRELSNDELQKLKEIALKLDNRHGGGLP